MSTGARIASSSTTIRQRRRHLRLQSQSQQRRRIPDPPAFAEGMYNRQITGMSQAARLEIVKP